MSDHFDCAIIANNVATDNNASEWRLVALGNSLER